MNMKVIITKGDKVVGEFEKNGEQAYLMLCNLFAMKLNDKTSVKLWDSINTSNRQREIYAETEIKIKKWLYSYTFTGLELTEDMTYFYFKN